MDKNDTDFNEAKKVGGEKKHTLTVNEMPSHIHNIIYANNGKAINLDGGGNTYNLSWGTSGYSGNGIITTPTGGGQEHNNMPPYFTCYIWCRIA